MKKLIFKTIYFIAIFVLSCFLIGKWMNQGNTDMTEAMSEPTLPVMYLEIDGIKVDLMYGYTEEMDFGYMRDNLAVIDQDRRLSFVIETYGADITGMRYEVRSLDKQRLIEDTEVNEYSQVGDQIKGTVVIKDLISRDQEYMLIFILETANHSQVRYYSRLIQTDHYYIAEKLAYVRDFHNKTFDKEAAQELTKYLESNSQGDNTTFHKVNIHSSFNQVTWGDLNVRQITDTIIRIRELNTATGYFELCYLVQIDEPDAVKEYIVSEWYRIRYTSERMYLLDFERTMTQVFDEEADNYTNDKIDLGINEEVLPMMESETGDVLTFVSSGKLMCFDEGNNKMARLFSFYTSEHRDFRYIHNQYDVKILNIDETGNVLFMVYGYMNRGRHEGQLGVAIYQYNSMQNTIEEKIFLKYLKSYSILRNDIEQLAYVNRSEVCYLILDGSIYAIDLKTQSYDVVTENLSDDSYFISDSGQMVVWSDGEDRSKSSILTLMNLFSGKQIEISAGNGEFIRPLGFMGEDVIYGVAKRTDVIRDLKGTIQFPMWCVRIENNYGDVLKEYIEEGYYITDCSVYENQIILTRKTMNADTGALEEAPDDQIMRTQEMKKTINSIVVAATENYEKIVQIRVKNELDDSSMMFLTPKEILYEGNREIDFGIDKDPVNRYYVYGLKGVYGIYLEENNAVEAAYRTAGVVIGEKGEYLWRRTNRSAKNQIMAIEAPEQTEAEQSMASCLDTILRYEGISTNSAILLSRGKTALNILEENLPDAQILNLTGCTLDAVLYYVDLDIPILAIRRDQSVVLITGFNDSQIVLYDPTAGDLYKIDMTEAQELFSIAGNQFITYME